MSALSNRGLAAVPPTGLGKSSTARRRQLLTAARETPAISAMSLGATRERESFIVSFSSGGKLRRRAVRGGVAVFGKRGDAVCREAELRGQLVEVRDDGHVSACRGDLCNLGGKDAIS